MKHFFKFTIYVLLMSVFSLFVFFIIIFSEIFIFVIYNVLLRSFLFSETEKTSINKKFQK